MNSNKNSKNVLYWNCANGIFNKSDLIKDKIKVNEPELFFIAESEISKTMQTSISDYPGYELSHSKTMSETRKSRICCFSKPEWQLLEELLPIDDEILLYKKGDHIVIGIYRPFKLYINEVKRFLLLFFGL